ncbi:MAG: hypothetical protein ACI9WC_003809 [Arenicella sp.]|jgi:hypothetical protein
MYSLLKNSIMLSSLVMLELAHAALPQAIAVWPSENDGDYAVYSSELYNDGWTPATIAAQSENRIIAAAVGSASFIAMASDKEANASLLTTGLITVWTEMVGEQWLLKFATRDDNTWTTAEQLTTLGGENLAPTIVHDLSGNPWVFWSSNATGHDDIYLTRRINGRWSDTEMVNEPNEFPDFLPLTHIADNGDIVVEWDTMDTSENLFIKNKKIYPNSTGVSITSQTNDEVTDPGLPDSGRTKARINLHYPGNRFIQSSFSSQTY